MMISYVEQAEQTRLCSNGATAANRPTQGRGCRRFRATKAQTSTRSAWMHGGQQFRPRNWTPDSTASKPKDVDRKLNLNCSASGGNTGYPEELGRQPTVTLRQLMSRLRKTYCGKMDVEYMHMNSREKCMGSEEGGKPGVAQVLQYTWLSFADTFKKSLQNKYNTVMRFGLDGGESVVPGLKAMVDIGAELGTENYIFGMAHRGRLNVHANILRKPVPQIFKEFQRGRRVKPADFGMATAYGNGVQGIGDG